MEHPRSSLSTLVFSADGFFTHKQNPVLYLHIETELHHFRNSAPTLFNSIILDKKLGSAVRSSYYVKMLIIIMVQHINGYKPLFKRIINDRYVTIFFKPCSAVQKAWS